MLYSHFNVYHKIKKKRKDGSSSDVCLAANVIHLYAFYLYYLNSQTLESTLPFDWSTICLNTPTMLLRKARFPVEDVLSITEPMTITLPCDKCPSPWEVQVATSPFTLVITPCPSPKDTLPGLIVTLIVPIFVTGTLPLSIPCATYEFSKIGPLLTSTPITR